MTTIEIILTAIGSGCLVTLVTLRYVRHKAKAEAESLHIENAKKLLEINEAYVVEPLKKELNGLRKDVRMLQRSISRIGDCPNANDCPVRVELQKHENNNRES